MAESSEMQADAAEAGPAPDDLRLPDLELLAGPRELELELELPKQAQFEPRGDNKLSVISSGPDVLDCGAARFEPLLMRWMVPLTAAVPGEVTLSYALSVAYLDSAGAPQVHSARLAQHVIVRDKGGSTVPWAHYRVTA